MKRIQKKSSGFSLIELLVVATIIIVLTTIGLVSFQSTGRNARDAKRKADLETVRQALVLRRADLGGYPIGTNYTNMTGTLISGQYLSAPAPVDPKNVAPNVYSYSSTPPGNGFCLCASMENPGNSGGGGGTCTFMPANGYCIGNP